MTGYVYYEEVYGALKSVSMRPVEGMDYPVVEVEDEQALAFLSGTADLWAWTIDADLKLVSMASLRMHLNWASWDTLPILSEAVGIIVRTSPSSRYAEIVLIAPEKMSVESVVTDRFRFVFTHPGDPDGILASIDVSIRDLNQQRSVVVHLPVMPARFDISTLAFQGLGYSHEIVDVIAPIIPLPRGRFEDIVPMRRQQPSGSCLAAYVCDDELRIRTLAGGGPRYDRGRDHIRLAVTKRNNPDHVLFYTTVSLEDLEEGSVVLDCPYEYSQIDLFTDLMYRDAFFSEHPWIIP